jgi:hypothetical protein
MRTLEPPTTTQPGVPTSATRARSRSTAKAELWAPSRRGLNTLINSSATVILCEGSRYGFISSMRCNNVEREEGSTQYNRSSFRVFIVISSTFCVKLSQGNDEDSASHVSATERSHISSLLAVGSRSATYVIAVDPSSQPNLLLARWSTLSAALRAEAEVSVSGRV